MKRPEEFNFVDIPETFCWYNEPAKFKTGDGLGIWTNEKTDFWQKTHYGFIKDDGHCLFTKINGNFSVMTHVEYEPKEKYDQCGLMIRVDSNNWIKVSTEYENTKISRLGSVVTNSGYSDWATSDITSAQKEMWYRISRSGSDFLVENSFDGVKWNQMRIAHLHSDNKLIEAGPYACSPIGRNFHCCFSYFSIDENNWFYKDECS